jgi:PPP family 3-phenylpropionic acid transporter
MNHQNVAKQAGVLSAFYFLHYATLGIVFPFAGYFFREKGLTGTEIGLYLSIFPFAKFVITNYWTQLFAASQRKHLFFACCIAVSSMSLVPLAFTSDKLLLVFLLTAFAFSRAGIIPISDSIAISLDGHIAYGRLRLFGSLGFIATSVTAGYLIDNFGLNAFVWAFMTAGLLSVIPSLFLDFTGEMLKPVKKEERRLSPELAVFFAGLTIYLTSFAFLSNFFNIKVDQAGFSQTWAGYMWSIGVISEIVFLYNQDIILKIFKVKTLIAVSMFLAGIRYLVTGYTDSLYVLLIFSTFNGFAYGTFHIGVMRYFKICVPDRLKLKAQSMYSGFGYGLGSIAGSAVSGVIYDVYGLKSVFATAFLFCTAAAVIIYLSAGKNSTCGGRT